MRAWFKFYPSWRPFTINLAIAADDMITSVLLFDSKEGADASTAMSKQWIADNGFDALYQLQEMSAGEVVMGVAYWLAGNFVYTYRITTKRHFLGLVPWRCLFICACTMKI
ncbi:MAG: hypothetical protein A3A33_01245 [Candidatus Yanofskybacteria bacterium RIFCSPLOWO2_01_FULL_49_25]|uniref:Uncharacterized protein n=1 Tax=Candidatus Yanofskybacteria bacterium RIFCSPLOWO2_01_FULL_49_25 TaxID=1802701 RepID=A0A1F8GXB0_9BACT|nr:MAG: hypothetical protein A3A33_01245 [Candidatus Yanofskybacteria bacterium RIFCSPLOWO2_01_FULL_49_25]